MLLFGAALRIIADDLGEAIEGRNPLKHKCTWCKDLYNMKIGERERRMIYGNYKRSKTIWY